MKDLFSIIISSLLCSYITAQTKDSVNANNYSYEQVAELVKFPKLRYLKLYSYQDAELPDIFDQLPNLEYLEINYAKIKKIPASIGTLSKLKTLIICNGFSELVVPAEIGKLTRLTKLHLYNYHFSKVPAEIGSLENLEYLILSGDLTELPSSIQNWRNLKNLYLAGNKFREIPSPIFQLVQLKDLNVSKNEIHQLNDSIRLLEQLTELSLDGNIQLSEFPAHFCELRKLENLYIQNTKINSLPGCLNELSSLKRIRMCKTIIDNPAGIDSVFGEKMDWEWMCRKLESQLIDFHEIYGTYDLKLKNKNDTVILHYKYVYNHPGSVDEEFTQNITIKILNKDSLRLNHIYTASNPHFIISSNHFSVWDWSPPKNQEIQGYLQFMKISGKEYKVYLNLDLIENKQKKKLVDKFLTFD